MADAPSAPVAAPPRRQRWFGLAHLVIFGAGIGFFVLSFVALGVLPGLRLEHEMGGLTQAGDPSYTDAELRGRHTYASLGCALCHTQQVRFLPADVRRWGPPTQAWETRNDFPQLWGTRRIGPDLARETGVRSDDWQLTHLYSPQSVVPGSSMPTFPWLFDGSPARPTVAATELVAYLNTLGRARRQSGSVASSLAADAGMDPALMAEITSLCATPFINPSEQFVVDGPPTADISATPQVVAMRPDLPARGNLLFAQNCVGCHGTLGDGAGPAAGGLLPRPTNLRASRYSTQSVASALWNGIAGSSMPAWREFSATDLASLVTHVQTLHAQPGATGSPDDLPLLARGATVYAVNCVSCHGANGDGNGPAAKALLPRPADLTHKQPDARLVAQVLNKGVPGTSMPAWPGLSGADRLAVGAFVRTL
ncbi:MAG: cbb3-type cytochrome c oxidase subunit II, partial [Bacteriovorax sp.]|nr:cbb3-type cytochrome c oxidase subunit II [Rhizobacter sp.]